MSKANPKVNTRRLNALAKRITNRTIAEELGVSESTVYRYKKGKVKKPKFNINDSVNRLWDLYKSSKPTTNPHLKRKREETKLDYVLERIDKHKFARTKDFVYRFTDFNESGFQDMVDDIHNKHKLDYFLVRIICDFSESDALIENKILSTRIVNIVIDDIDTLYEVFMELIVQYHIEFIHYFELVAKDLFNA